MIIPRAIVAPVVAALVAVAVVPAAVAQAVLQNWYVQEDVSRFDDTKKVLLGTGALVPYQDAFGIERRPMVVLRCFENETSLHFAFDGEMMIDSSVLMRIDDRSAQDQVMQASTDHRALGLWLGDSSIPLIKSLFGGKRMLVRATPVNSSSVTVEFDISGLDHVIRPLRGACNW